jgi:hypothetical protein
MHFYSTHFNADTHSLFSWTTHSRMNFVDLIWIALDLVKLSWSIGWNVIKLFFWLFSGNIVYGIFVLLIVIAAAAILITLGIMFIIATSIAVSFRNFAVKAVFALLAIGVWVGGASLYNRLVYGDPLFVTTEDKADATCIENLCNSAGLWLLRDSKGNPKPICSWADYKASLEAFVAEAKKRKAEGKATSPLVAKTNELGRCVHLLSGAQPYQPRDPAFEPDVPDPTITGTAGPGDDQRFKAKMAQRCPKCPEYAAPSVGEKWFAGMLGFALMVVTFIIAASMSSRFRAILQVLFRGRLDGGVLQAIRYLFDTQWHVTRNIFSAIYGALHFAYTVILSPLIERLGIRDYLQRVKDELYRAFIDDRAEVKEMQWISNVLTARNIVLRSVGPSGGVRSVVPPRLYTYYAPDGREIPVVGRAAEVSYTPPPSDRFYGHALDDMPMAFAPDPPESKRGGPPVPERYSEHKHAA